MNASESEAALFLCTFSSESDKKARELELAGFMAEKATFTALLEDLAIARSRDRKVWVFCFGFLLKLQILRKTETRGKGAERTSQFCLQDYCSVYP